MVNAASALFPPCPSLPEALPGMSYQSLRQLGPDRGAAFYETCLRYGQSLWAQRLPARAILCLDRAMGADLTGDEPILKNYPMPYAGMRWFLEHCPEGVFMGNPRVHFQHYADRLGPPRADIRRWRAWACWYLTRQLLPQLPGDPRHLVQEPTPATIETNLQKWGLPNEPELWKHSLN